MSENSGVAINLILVREQYSGGGEMSQVRRRSRHFHAISHLLVPE